MKLVWCLVFTLIMYSLPAQNLVLEGQILNAETHEPLPFVNILMLSKKIGTSTDENGKLQMGRSAKCTK